MAPPLKRRVTMIWYGAWNLSLTEVAEAIRERILSSCPDERTARDFLTDLLETHLTGFNDARKMGVARSSASQNAASLSSALETASRIGDLESVLERPEGIVDLGNLYFILRPMYRLKNGLLADAIEPPWNHLKRGCVADVQQRCCRIRFRYGSSFFRKIGSGFVISEDRSGAMIALTNHHVLEQAKLLGLGTDKDVSLTACFSDEELIQASSSREYGVEIYATHPNFDVAAIKFTNLSGDSTHLISSGGQVSYSNDVDAEQEIGVIGFPTIDTSIDTIFFPNDGTFVAGSKIMSPGKILSASAERRWQGEPFQSILHDATTFSGSSGSCIVDLQTQSVVGIHFGGWPSVTKKYKKGVLGREKNSLFEANGALSWKEILSDAEFCDFIGFGEEK